MAVGAVNDQKHSIRVTGKRRQSIDTRQLTHLLIRMARRQRGEHEPVQRQGVIQIDGDEECERDDGR